MPVSRRRKKKGRGVSAARRSTDVGAGGVDLAGAWANIRAHHAKLGEARSAFASARAAAAVSEHLIDLAAAAGTDAQFEDVWCGWLGPWLLVAEGARLEEDVDPNDAFDALVHAVANRVTEVLDRWDTESEVGLRLWRVLAALPAIAPDPLGQHCACRKLRPCCSGGMLVFVDDAAEPVVAADVEVGDPVRIGDRVGDRRSGAA